MRRPTKEDGVEIGCIYRETRGDWTFPKGKVDEGESFEVAAVREVFEETGIVCQIERFIGTTNYQHRKGRPKIVAYFLMSIGNGSFAPNEKFDKLVWFPVYKVRARLTWDRDRELFDRAQQLPELRPRT